MNLLPILGAVVAYLGWGAADIFAVIASRRIGSYASIFWTMVWRAGLLAVLLPFAADGFRHATLANLTAVAGSRWPGS